ncbi:MAG: glycerol-3-phosphate dehydrogenase subunit GlpB [Halobacteriaceae archaeon]
MAIEDDVVVVGGGLAGRTAALAAARQGARVRMLSHKESTLRHASGLIDVLGYPPGERGPVADPLAAAEAVPEGHPYERAGQAAIEAGLSLFDEVTGDAYRGGHTDRNALAVTAGGRLKPTARYPASVAPGLASDARETLLVGFERVPDFDAPLAADRLRAAGVPFDARGVTVRFPGDLRDDVTVTRLATMLDDDERVATGDGARPARTALADRVRPHVGGAERVGFPAVLGDAEARSVRRALSAALDADVFEVPMGPPSLPGMRLADLLDDALDAAGVRTTTGNPVVDYAADGDRVTRVVVDRNGAAVPFAASAFVLATGGLVGTGVEADRDRVTEPVFDCHVPQPEDRYDWFVDDPFGDHAFARFGVRVDGDLRPRSASGDPEFANLRAAGAVLGGVDYATEQSGSGVSLATGAAAGRAAATDATSPEP